MQGIENAGTKVGQIPVVLAFRVIELFSKGLYSSPNKAFEELVCNAYDAFATNVSVYVPEDVSANDAVLWVCDNGESMDSKGLHLLWQIGFSTKRLAEYDTKDRPPIGKFGIGKLATYILARKLTYICRVRNKYRAVTMDYGRLDPDSSKPVELQLDERELTESETMHILKPLISAPDGRSYLNFDLWGRNAEESWTFVIMSDLKPAAHDITEGKLKWILSSALPLSPNFKLLYNGKEIESSKAKEKPLKVWTIGANDEVASKFGYPTGTFRGNPCVNLPKLKNVFGTVELYRDSLVSGKSDRIGRSHGIFLMVRERLVNLDDPLLGMSAMTHGVFNRIRFLIHADDLDTYLTSTRESIQDSEALRDLHKYIQRKFDEVRNYYFEVVANEEKQKQAKYKVSRADASLSRKPLLAVARKFFAGDITSNLFLIELPWGISESERKELLRKLEQELTTEQGIIKDVTWEPVAPEAPIARLDLVNGVARINLLHPFFANFIEEVETTLPFKLIATTEILTEAFMIESGVNEETVKEIMLRRDLFLREVTFSDTPNAPYVSQMLKAALTDPDGLEQAVYYAFNSLGFETTKIGGNGKPDGKAVAYLGIGGAGVRADYSVTYDAKSTTRDRIKATTAHISGVVRHREDYNANFAAVISVDFEGAMDPNSAISKEAKRHKINLIRAKDLMKLVLIASPKQIGFAELKTFFETCHTVIETSEWVDKVMKKEVKAGPIKELLETAWRLNKEDDEPVDLSALRHSHPDLRKHSKEDLRSLVQSIHRLVGSLISIKGEKISIQAPPERILGILNKVVRDVPHEFLDVYLKAYESRTEKASKN